MGDYLLKSVDHIQVLFRLVKWTLHEDLNRFMVLSCRWRGKGTVTEAKEIIDDLNRIWRYIEAICSDTIWCSSDILSRCDVMSGYTNPGRQVARVTFFTVAASIFEFLVCNLLCVTLLVPRTLKWHLDICQIYVPLCHTHIYIYSFRFFFLRFSCCIFKENNNM